MFFHVRTGEEPKVNPEEAEGFRWVTPEGLKGIENKEGAPTDLFSRNQGLIL